MTIKMKKHTSLLIFLFFMASCGTKPQSVTSTPFIPTETATLPPTSTPIASPVPTSTLPSVLITSGDWSEPYVALTFDLCQDPQYPAGYDAAIVEVLQRYGVAATFFMGGDWMRTHPEETKVLASIPNFELANHSWSHPDFTQLTEDEMAQQLETTEALPSVIEYLQNRGFTLVRASQLIGLEPKP